MDVCSCVSPIVWVVSLDLRAAKQASKDSKGKSSTEQEGQSHYVHHLQLLPLYSLSSLLGKTDFTKLRQAFSTLPPTLQLLPTLSSCFVAELELLHHLKGLLLNSDRGDQEALQPLLKEPPSLPICWPMMTFLSIGKCLCSGNGKWRGFGEKVSTLDLDFSFRCLPLVVI